MVFIVSHEEVVEIRLSNGIERLVSLFISSYLKNHLDGRSIRVIFFGEEGCGFESHHPVRDVVQW